MGKRLLLVALVLVMAPAVGCQERACTEIGCQDGLTFVLPASSEWIGSQVEICVGDLCGTVESLSSGDQQASDPLAGAVRLDGNRLVWVGSPERLDYEAPVELTVTGPFGGTGTRFDPDWTESRPNGPDCPPVCRAAEVDVGG